jgi:3-hydroxyisobutyrate dehydrogenase-like beta-hydroxyacid dehydrogenase
MTSASHQPHDPLHRLQGGEHIPFSRPPTPNHKDAPQVGFIGLGAMGRFMARNLAKNRSSHPSGSPPMVVWNRTISKAESLAKEVGGDKMRAAQSPAEVATECDIIVTNLANDEVVVQIYEEFAKALTVRFLVSQHVHC